MNDKELDCQTQANDNQTENLPSLFGTVEHITYHNDENGYTVCQISLLEHETRGSSKEGDIITVVGSLPYIAEGERLRLMGSWRNHVTFGRQFEIAYYEKSMPNTAEDMRKYLSSRAVKGIGASTANKIVERFGVDTFDVLENHPEFLTQINGITPEKAEAIGKEFRGQFGMRAVMMFCRDYFGAATSIRIYKKFGAGAVDVIKKNPYALCGAIRGIGFERADKVAYSIGYDREAPERIRAGIEFILSYNAASNGHCFLPRGRLIKAGGEVLSVDREKIEEALTWLTACGAIVAATVEGESVVYLKAYYDAEKYIAGKLAVLDAEAVGLGEENVDILIGQIEYERGITYAVKQKKAILLAATAGVSIFTGGPGTGKTTVIRAVIEMFTRFDRKIALAAPTGRAAKRMSEATGREAKTIHRLLEVAWGEEDKQSFRKNEEELLEDDVIIIDETSMVDTLLMASLLRAVKPGSKLILIGDIDQLPSVGAGNVLSDIINSDRFSAVRLTEIFRQAQESRIITNAHAINSGVMPTLTDKSSDFFFIEREESDIADTVADLIVRRLPKSYGAEATEGIQVITPSHKGAAGTIALNARLQAAVNPPHKAKPEHKFEVRTFRLGDKIMQIRNNYDIEWSRHTLLGAEDGHGVFNGDIGKIVGISKPEEKMAVQIDDKTLTYDYSDLDQLEHAYAITIHKAQGSEYPIVIIPVYPSASRLLTRELLYTAVTRAQKMVILVGGKRVIQQMVENAFRPKRYTGLMKG